MSVRNIASLVSVMFLNHPPPSKTIRCKELLGIEKTLEKPETNSKPETRKTSTPNLERRVGLSAPIKEKLFSELL